MSWVQKNPEIIARNTQLRRERMAWARAQGTHTREEWALMLEASNYTCVMCGNPGSSKDHIIPVYLGGSDSITNLQPLCLSCNCAKGPDRTDYRFGKPWMRPEWFPAVN